MKEKSILEIVSQRIKILRRERGITQAQLAEKIDKTVEMISHLENCSAATKLTTLEDIAKALNVDIYELFIEDDNLLAKDISPEMRSIIKELKNQTPETLNSLHKFIKNIKNI